MPPSVCPFIVLPPTPWIGKGEWVDLKRMEQWTRSSPPLSSCPQTLLNCPPFPIQEMGEETGISSGMGR